VWVFARKYVRFLVCISVVVFVCVCMHMPCVMLRSLCEARHTYNPCEILSLTVRSHQELPKLQNLNVKLINVLIHWSTSGLCQLRWSGLGIGLKILQCHRSFFGPKLEWHGTWCLCERMFGSAPCLACCCALHAPTLGCLQAPT